MTSTLVPPTTLRAVPFRGRTAISTGLLSRRMLNSRAWQRLFIDVFVDAASYDPDDHRMWSEAAKLVLPRGACLGGWSAAHYWGVEIVPQRAPVWVNIPLES